MGHYHLRAELPDGSVDAYVSSDMLALTTWHFDYCLRGARVHVAHCTSKH